MNSVSPSVRNTKTTTMQNTPLSPSPSHLDSLACRHVFPMQAEVSIPATASCSAQLVLSWLGRSSCSATFTSLLPNPQSAIAISRDIAS